MRFGAILGLVSATLAVAGVMPVPWETVPQSTTTGMNVKFRDEMKPVAPAEGPLKIHPVNSRYFADVNGNTVYLTGSHHWNNLLDTGLVDQPPTIFDYEQYLEVLTSHNHNFMRLWAWVGGVNGTYAAQVPYARTGPGIALDGQPKFDLDRFDDTYFDRLRLRIAAAQARGIYVSVMLFNGWSVYDNKQGDPWPLHPFHAANNVNRIHGNGSVEQQREIYTLRTPLVIAYQEAYVRRVIDALNDLDNLLYEIENENAPTSENTVWQYHMIDYVRAYERTKPKQHPVGMTVQWPNGSNRALLNSPADWISPTIGDGYDRDPPGGEIGKVVLSDTDHLWGVGGDDAWVWKTFTRGLNPIYMDPLHFIANGMEDPAGAEEARIAMGQTRLFASRMNLSATVPHGEQCSSRYCLADSGKEYLVYLPAGSYRFGSWIELLPYRVEMWIHNSIRHSVTVDLSSGRQPMNVEWFNPKTGHTVPGTLAHPGSRVTFTAPFPGPAVLYIRAS